MTSLTDTHVISTLKRYDLLRLGQDPTPDRDLAEWDVFAYDIADPTRYDNDLSPSNPDATPGGL